MVLDIQALLSTKKDMWFENKGQFGTMFRRRSYYESVVSSMLLHISISRCPATSKQMGTWGEVRIKLQQGKKFVNLLQNNVAQYSIHLTRRSLKLDMSMKLNFTIEKID